MFPPRHPAPGSSIIPGRQTAFLTFLQRNPSHRAGSQLCVAPPVAPEFTPELNDPVVGWEREGRALEVPRGEGHSRAQRGRGVCVCVCVLGGGGSNGACGTSRDTKLSPGRQQRKSQGPCHRFTGKTSILLSLHSSRESNFFLGSRCYPIQVRTFGSFVPFKTLTNEF